MTYAELITAIEDWAESTETRLVAQLDFMIELAEKRIYRSVDLDECKKHSLNHSSILSGTSDYTLPTDLVVPLDVYIQGVRHLIQKDFSYIEDLRSASGTPKYYALIDDTTIQLGPTPNASSGQLSYYYTYRPTQLSDSQTTTWLSLNAPDVLLAACLKEVAVFQKQEQDIIAMYDKMYQEAFQGTMLEENYRRRQDEYRAGEIKVNV